MVRMNVAGLRCSCCNTACGLLWSTVANIVSPLNIYDVVVAYFAPLPVDEATLYNLNG